VASRNSDPFGRGPTPNKVWDQLSPLPALSGVVPWNFDDVVRISTNSLWETAFLDLEKEPMVVTVPIRARFPSQRAGVSGLLMETGVSYNKLRLHCMGYFKQLLSTSEEISDNIRPLLKLCREHIYRSIRLDTTLLRSVERDPLLGNRLRRLRTIPELARLRP